MLVLLALASVNFIDYFEPLRVFLASNIMTFKLGSISFSVYAVIKSVFTIVVMMWVLSIFSEIGEKKIKSIRGVKASNKALIVKAFQIVVYSFAFMFALDVLSIDLKTLSMFGGALSIGLGFGLQKIASNFISGIILLFEKSIENDDLVELPDGTRGFVRYTRARYTLIESSDGKEIIVPNEELTSRQVINYTHSNNAGRIEVMLAIPYSVNIDETCSLITKCAEEYQNCLSDPAPSCLLTEFTPTSIKVSLFFWVTDISKGRYRPRSWVMMRILQKFNENGIEIPKDHHNVSILNENVREILTNHCYIDKKRVIMEEVNK